MMFLFLLWGWLEEEWEDWTCPLGDIFSMFMMLHFSGKTLGKPWLLHWFLCFLVGWVIFISWVLGRSISWRDGLGDTRLMRRSYHMEVSSMEEEKSCNTHLVSFLRKRNILEGRTIIFPISHELIGIFIFVFLPCLKNKRAKEVHISP